MEPEPAVTESEIPGGLHIVTGDYWNWIFLEGELIYSGHPPSGKQMLEILDHKFTTREIIDDDEAEDFQLYVNSLLRASGRYDD